MRKKRPSQRLSITKSRANKEIRSIAITGGLAEGKSTVLGYCKAAGYRTASADEVAREVFEDDSVQASIAKLLGSEPPIERQVVRAALEESPAFRRELNRLTHSGIIRKLKEARAQVVEVPLLIEVCLQGDFDRVWVVSCGREEQIRRLSERLGSCNAGRLLASQLPTSAKTPFADCIVRTNQPEAAVQAYVLERVHAELG